MNFELFLTQISSITKKYDEILSFSGENFNIFNILGLSSDEKSHSKIIASLLNPLGTHGKNNKFTELFIQSIDINNFSTDGIFIEVEKHIGPVSKDYDRGGRIDIVLTKNKDQQIFIENKIYANDQYNQLLRYHNYNSKAHLLYLTLFGDTPSENSTGKENKLEYKIISYKEHILNWLELCKKESVDNPVLRETITQYIILIKQLTDQGRSKDMEREYLDTILKDVNNVSAALTVSQNINVMKLQLIKEKFVPLVTEIAANHELNIDISLDRCFENNWGFSFKKPDWKQFRIDFRFNSGDMNNLYYGFKGSDISNKLKDYLRCLNYKYDNDWPFWQYMEKYKNWDNDFYIDLYSNPGNIFNTFESKIEEILCIVENIKEEL